MDDMFCVADKFMVRIPTDTDEDVSFSDEEIQNMCKDKKFMEKVMIASPSMVEIIEKYLKEPEKLSQKKLDGLRASVMKYYSRSKKRATPFGLFSAVGVGSFSEKTSIKVSSIQFQKKLNIDCKWLYDWIKKIEIEKKEKLYFGLNGACYESGNRVYLLYAMEKDVEEVSVRHTHVLDIIVSNCKKMQNYELLVSAIQNEYKDTDREIITKYLDEIIEKEILISNLRPSFTCKNPLGYVIEQCKSSGLIEEMGIFKQIENLCQSYEQTAIGEGRKYCIEIFEQMKKMQKETNYIQVDTILKNCSFELSKDYAKKIQKLATFLCKLGNHYEEHRTILTEYKDKFIEKYGVEREVPLLEMLDGSKGIGAPNGYMIPRNEFYEEPIHIDQCAVGLKRYFLSKYEKAIRNKEDIIFREKEIKPWLKEELKVENIPSSMELYFELQDCNGEIGLLLGSNCGSFGAGKTFGRFSVVSEECEAVLNELEEKEQNLLGENICRCDINFLPSNARSGNIVRAHSGREKELTLYVNESKDKKQIGLRNIVIGVENEKFYAKDCRDNRKIIVQTNHMFNMMLQPNALRFLQEIGAEGRLGWAEFPWKSVYEDFVHVPEIKIEDITIARERWIITQDVLGIENEGIEDFSDKMHQFILQEKMPVTVYLAEEDNRVYLDLSKRVAIQILYDELKKNVNKKVILEKAEEKTLVWGDGKKYATEIVVPLHRKQTEVVAQTPKQYDLENESIRRGYLGENWIYLKLYCKKEQEIELIVFYIQEFCDEIKRRYGVESFFMRYEDPKPHVRLRFYKESENFYECLPEILSWGNQLLREEIVSDIQMLPYDREVERYGGCRLIHKAEEVFFADSRLVEQILAAVRVKRIEILIEEIAVASVLSMVQEFYKTSKEQLDFLERNYHETISEKEWKEKKQRLVDCLDIENNWEGYRAQEEREYLYQLFQKRAEWINNYQKTIAQEEKSEQEKNDIVVSILHLHCNRLLGTDRQLEQKVMTLAESVLYAKKYVLLKRENDANRKN